jgi:hypothetical protein
LEEGKGGRQGIGRDLRECEGGKGRMRKAMGTRYL